MQDNLVLIKYFTPNYLTTTKGLNNLTSLTNKTPTLIDPSFHRAFIRS
jgi:competence transcription factor ComK